MFDVEVSFGSFWLPASCLEVSDGIYTCTVKYSKLAQQLDLISLTLCLPKERVKVIETPKSEIQTAIPQKAEDGSSGEDQALVTPSDDVSEDAPSELAPSEYRLLMSAEPEFDSCAYGKSAAEFHSLVTVAAPKLLNAGRIRPGVDVVCVLDVSGSMSGAKISLLRKSVRRLVSHLGANDRCAFVTFDTYVNTLMPFRSMDEEGKEHAQQLVHSIVDGSSTDLCAGLLKGMEVLKSGHKNDVTTVLLFTDGEAVSGITSNDGILQAAIKAGTSASQDPRKWCTTDVCNWLESIGLGMYSNNFSAKAVDGTMLIEDISDTILQQSLDVDFMHLNKFKREIQKLRTSTYAGPEGEGEADHLFMQVNTFGFGADHNVELLKNLASRFDGMYYYMKDERSIIEGFANCLGGMLSTVAQDIELMLKPSPGVKDFVVRKEDNVVYHADGSATVKFGDLQAEEARHVVVQATLPALNAPQKGFALFETTMEYRNLVKKVKQDATTVCTVARGKAHRGTPSVAVDISKNRVISMEAMVKAEKLADKEDFEAARNIIRSTRDSIAKSVSAKDKFCVGVVEDLNKCFEGLKSRSEYMNKTRKYMAQNVMCHTLERAANFDKDFGAQNTYNTEQRTASRVEFRRKNRHDDASFSGVAALFGEWDEESEFSDPAPEPDTVASLFGKADNGSKNAPFQNQNKPAFPFNGVDDSGEFEQPGLSMFE